MKRRAVGGLIATLLASIIAGPSGAEVHSWNGAPDGGPALEPPVAAAPIQGGFRAWTGIPADVPGMATVSNGEIVVTDYVFDDSGADLTSDPTSDLISDLIPLSTQSADVGKAPAGEYAYPEHSAFAGNAADIVEVRVAADHLATYLLLVLNTLIDPGRSAFHIGIDERVISIHGLSGDIDGDPIEVLADAEANIFEVRIPRSSFDPADATMSIFVASGLWDPGLETWVHPAPESGAAPYFDLAYVPDEPASAWHDRKQAKHIADGSFSEDAFLVNFAGLGAGNCGTEVCVSLSPLSFHTRILRSAQPPVGVPSEGVWPQTRWRQAEVGTGRKLYATRFQPYALYVPLGDPDVPRPLLLLLHPADANHMSYPLADGWDRLRELADELGLIVAMPFARGEGGWYEGEAEKDVFEVWRDVARHVAVDRERVYLAGVGMGGFGALRLGHLYPDQFATVAALAAPVTPHGVWPAPLPLTHPQPSPPACEGGRPGCGYNLTDLFGNARSVPHLLVYGGLDGEVPVTGPEYWLRRFDEAGNEHEYRLYPARGGEASLLAAVTNRIFDLLHGLPTRWRAPARVTYRILPHVFQPAYGLTYDAAYWIKDMRVDEGAAEGIIEAVLSDTVEAGTPWGPTVGTDDVGPHRRQGRQAAPVNVRPNFVEVVMRGLSYVLLDTSRMGMDRTRPIQIAGETDIPTRLTMTGPFPEDTLVEGADHSVQGSDLVILLPSGTLSVTITPKGEAGA